MMSHLNRRVRTTFTELGIYYTVPARFVDSRPPPPGDVPGHPFDTSRKPTPAPPTAPGIEGDIFCTEHSCSEKTFFSRLPACRAHDTFLPHKNAGGGASFYNSETVETRMRSMWRFNSQRWHQGHPRRSQAMCTNDRN